MIIAPKNRVVFLGLLTRIPVAGAVWGAMQYLIGFQRLGYEVFYVEAHQRPPSALLADPRHPQATAKSAAFLARVMRRFGLEDRWAYHALHDDGQCYGLSKHQLADLYRTAVLLINYHGATQPLPEHTAPGCLLYLETDPVPAEIRFYHNDDKTIDLMRAHSAFATWGLNYGHADCLVPVPEGLHFHPSPPVIVSEYWSRESAGKGNGFTTVGNWRQKQNSLRYRGVRYHWSKHHEFLKFIDLPQRSRQRFELALSSSSYDEEDRRLLESKGWSVKDALKFSQDLDAYRTYISQSRGEFTVAKDQNVRLRSGWFSERTAQYLAAGKPVITQETGFSNYLPTGEGLFSFTTMDDILAAVDRINSAYERHSRAASDIARSYFSYDLVLPRLVAAAAA